ncbi:TPA: type 1 fimbrial protein [Klebsiella michiganensis]|nr:type 1 fimbrial protein [Klebsiella michiganensis]HCB1845614.1 type 1 fimbrial protein [Klebsiella oxytoca]
MRITAAIFKYIGIGLLPLSTLASAHDGIITLNGRAVAGTCVFDGVSAQASDAPSSSATITLPAVSADSLENNESEGETRFYFHFRNCDALVGQSAFAASLFTDNVSEDRMLFLPDNTPDSAKNVGLKIQWGNTYSTPVHPNQIPYGYANFAFLNANGGKIVSNQYRVAYKKIPGSGAVLPGKVNTTVTYEISYR